MAAELAAAAGVGVGEWASRLGGGLSGKGGGPLSTSRGDGATVLRSDALLAIFKRGVVVVEEAALSPPSTAVVPLAAVPPTPSSAAPRLTLRAKLSLAPPPPPPPPPRPLASLRLVEATDWMPLTCSGGFGGKGPPEVGDSPAPPTPLTTAAAAATAAAVASSSPWNCCSSRLLAEGDGDSEG